jgi:hypothetical protein
MDFLDPTITQRDPSFDPNTNTFDAADPSSVAFFRQTRSVLTSGKRLARPAIWEQLNTLTGRRLRDSFMPGSGTLSLGVMQKMRSVLLCESTVESHTAGGLNQLGYVTPGASCQPIGESPRPPSVCTVLPSGKATCRARTRSAFSTFPLAPVGGSSSRAAQPGVQGPFAADPEPSPWVPRATQPRAPLAEDPEPSPWVPRATQSRARSAEDPEPSPWVPRATQSRARSAEDAEPSPWVPRATQSRARLAEDPDPSLWIPRASQSHAVSQRGPRGGPLGGALGGPRGAPGNLALRPPARAP